jgi:hemoglobin
MTQYADAARLQKANDALVMGIDATLISQLVDRFYASIRTHDVLGPIFAEHITDWPSHLARMKNFWSSLIVGTGQYHGNPMAKHIAIPGIGPAHFKAWLGLWDSAVAEIVRNPAATELFRSRARRVATSLETAITLNNGGLAAFTKGDIPC